MAAPRIGHADTNAGHFVGRSWRGEFGLFSQSDSRLWGISTGQPQAYLVLEDDGEFLVLSPSGATLWTSETAVE